LEPPGAVKASSEEQHTIFEVSTELELRDAAMKVDDAPCPLPPHLMDGTTLEDVNECWSEQTSEEVDDFELTFDNLKLEEIDQSAFKVELIASFQNLGMDEATISRLQISLREDSVIVNVQGPCSTMAEIASVPVNKVVVMGCGARVTKVAEKAWKAAALDPEKYSKTAQRHRASSPSNVAELEQQALWPLEGYRAEGFIYRNVCRILK